MCRIKFTVNGVEHSVGSEIPSAVMLVDYLRYYLQLSGTKYMCREGGCGACMVTASKSPGSPYVAMNSCLVAVTQCQGWDIKTIEGLGNRNIGYHKIQKTLAENHGTQCGYCSPGWVMSMYGFMNQTTNPTMLEIEKAFGSNVCRCTGYRPIMQAFKKFGSDAPVEDRIKDIEDLHICRKNKTHCKRVSCIEDEWCVVEDKHLKDNDATKITLKDGKVWYRPTQLADVYDILKNDVANDDYMLVGGNTAKGVSPIDEYPSVMIDISALAELQSNEVDQNLVVGAGCTLNDFMDILKATSEKENFKYLLKLHNHVDKVAHIPIRNVATIGGNLMIKHKKKAFQSDIFLVLDTVGAQLTIEDYNSKSLTVSMEDFLSLDMTGKVIINVLLPPLNDDEYHVVTFKIMPRAQSAHAIVNAGFLYKLDSSNVVQECRIVYGALSTDFIRATTTETHLVGKSLFTNETLKGALKVLDAELVVEESPPEPSAEFRQYLAKALFFKGLLTLCPSSDKLARYVSGSTNLHEERGVSQASQTYPIDTSKWPLNKPIGKLDGLIQCAGEAKYTEDIPSMPNEVFGAFVLSTVALGTIVEIDASVALKLSGVIAFYTAEDIPGLNSFTPADYAYYQANEEVLADGTVKYYHQPIGIIVAETYHIANRATKLVKVTYSNTSTPVIDIKEARNDSSRNTLYVSKEATNTGTDISKKITGSHTFGAQYPFFMETQVCVAKPTEEGLEVHSATQWIDGTHIMISRALAIEENKIDVYVRRIGGGYGMKISRSIQAAVACSLVVHKLNRPCRFIQPLTTNTRAIGKRLPCVNDFTVAVNSTGVIQYIDTTIYEDNGYMINETLTALGVDVYNNCYDITKFNYKAYDTITDTAKNSWCRAPGTFETISFLEFTMEQIAYEMSLDPLDVRMANLDTTNYGDMTEMVTTLKTSAEYTARRATVNTFNTENRWKKRGLRFSFARWAPTGYLKLGVNISIFHTDGTVMITHSGVEMGQGIDTKVAQMAAYFLKCPLEKIQIKGNCSNTNPNSFMTGGSLGTQSICIALKRGCDELLARFAPIEAMLKASLKTTTTWETLVQTAFTNDIDLQVHSYVGASDILTYSIYGIACAEVEVDLLTGEFKIIRVDLLQDVGMSISQEIDIGQVEGAFIMGVGYWTCEKIAYDSSGELLTDRSWDIHIPQIRDTPEDFRVALMANSYSVDKILGSKGTGEPAICLSVVIPLAIREAISEGRKDCGKASTEWFAIDGPYSNEKICKYALSSSDDFAFN